MAGLFFPKRHKIKFFMKSC